MEDRILKLLINRVAGFIVFLLILVLLNIFITYIDFPLIKEIVLFFNSKVLTIGILLLFIVLGEIFMMLNFPLNFPGPIFNAAGSIFIILFILDIFQLLMTLGGISLPSIPFDLIFLGIAIVVCLVVLITGYVSIFRNRPKKMRRGARREEEEEEEPEEEPEEEEKEKVRKEKLVKEKTENKKEEKHIKPILKKKVKKVKIRE